jgi:SlyX protein
MNESIKRLEEKVAYLERHVTEQDKVMLEMAEDLARLRLQLIKLREQTASTGEPNPESKLNDRPPHY